MIRLLLVALAGLLPLMATDTSEPVVNCGLIRLKQLAPLGVPIITRLGGIYQCVAYDVPPGTIGVKIVLRYEIGRRIVTAHAYGEVSNGLAIVSVETPDEIRVVSRDLHLLTSAKTFSADQ